MIHLHLDPRRGCRAALLLLVLPLCEIACRGPQSSPEPIGRAGLRVVPEPDLTDADESVQEQLAGQQAALRVLLADPGTAEPELAERFGDLGLLYVTYSFLEAAEASFRNAQTLAPDDYRWPYLQGYLYQLQGLPGAAETLGRALDLGPAHLPTLIRLGQVELERGNRERAAELFGRVLERDPEAAVALDGLARIAAAAGDQQRAVALFQRVLAAQPAASSVHHALGLAYRALGDLEQARDHLEKGGDGPVLFVDPLLQPVSHLGRSAEIYLVRAAQAFSEERFDIAATAYRQALEIEPGNFTTHKALGFCLEKLGDIPGAIEQLQLALRVGDTGEGERNTLEQAEVHRILGGLAVLHGTDAEGIEHFLRSLELNPDQLDARFKLANALARAGRFQEALDHFDLLLRAQPDHAATLVNRATALINLGRAEEALSNFERAVELAPESPQNRLRYIDALEFVGQRRRASEQRALLQLLAKEDRRRAELAAEEAARALREGRYQSAASSFREALRSAPADADLRFQLASVLGHLGRYDEALAELDEVIAAAPRHGPARRSQVTALLLQGRYGAARQRLHEALEVLPRDRRLAHVLARLLAIAPDDRVRDGRLAVELAMRVRAADPGKEADETLAMAYAEAGRLEEAVALQAEILRAAEPGADSASTSPAQARLTAYRSQRPWRALSPDEIIRAGLAPGSLPG